MFIKVSVKVGKISTYKMMSCDEKNEYLEVEWGWMSGRWSQTKDQGPKNTWATKGVLIAPSLANALELPSPKDLTFVGNTWKWKWYWNAIFEIEMLRGHHSSSWSNRYKNFMEDEIWIEMQIIIFCNFWEIRCQQVEKATQKNPTWMKNHA